MFSASRYLRLHLKMTGKASLELVKGNLEVAKKRIIDLKNELNILNTQYNNMRVQSLREENLKLTQAVEEAKRKLVDLEVKKGVQQIPVPGTVKSNEVVNSSQIEDKTPEVKAEKKLDEPKEITSKKPKKIKEKVPPPTEPPVDVGRLDLRVAKVEDVQKHPDADSLYVLKINCGEEKPRTVCSGLVKYVSIEELKDRSVMLLCNLKPVKMRGITSEAMVMCASTSEAVEVLLPPADALPGDLVHCEGYTRQPDAVMNPKKKIFETVAPDLHTNESSQACYKGIPFSIPGKGNFVSKTLKNVPVK